MALFARAQSSAAWLAGFVVDQTTMESFEGRVAAGLNGHGGGTYAPSSPLAFTSDAGATLLISGPLKVCYQGALTTLTGARFVLPGSEFELLSPGHVGGTRTIITPFAEGGSVLKYASQPQLASAGLRAVALGFLADYLAPTEAYAATRSILPLRTCDGATLASVTLTYVAKLGTPRVRLVRASLFGGVTPLTLATAGADVDGWTKLPAADPNLAQQTVTIVCDVGVVVDKAANYYALEVEEDQTLAAIAPNVLAVKSRVRAASTANVTPLRDTPTIDGVATTPGDRILLRAQTNPKENGIWIVQGTSLDFVLADALRTDTTDPTTGIVTTTYEAIGPLAFPPAYVVSVQAGATLGGTFWQQTSGTIAIARPMAQPQTFEPIPALGNTYLAAAVNHTGITDTRWH